MLKLTGISDLSDEELFQSLPTDTAGRAFHELFDRYYTQLVAFAARILAQTDEPYDMATDVVQNLFVSVYERKDADAPDNVKSFLFSSTRNACLNVIKHQKIVRQYEDDALNTSSEIAPDADGADALIEQSEADAKIASALAKLPDQCRRIFSLSRFDGLSNQQIADQLDISKRTVETQISNALKTLRKILLTLLPILSDLLFPQI